MDDTQNLDHVYFFVKKPNTPSLPSHADTQHHSPPHLADSQIEDPDPIEDDVSSQEWLLASEIDWDLVEDTLTASPELRKTSHSGDLDLIQESPSHSPNLLQTSNDAKFDHDQEDQTLSGRVDDVEIKLLEDKHDECKLEEHVASYRQSATSPFNLYEAFHIQRFEKNYNFLNPASVIEFLKDDHNDSKSKQDIEIEAIQFIIAAVCKTMFLDYIQRPMKKYDFLSPIPFLKSLKADYDYVFSREATLGHKTLFASGRSLFAGFALSSRKSGSSRLQVWTS